jgi:mono/diheme cytochrome c family protein
VKDFESQARSLARRAGAACVILILALAASETGRSQSGRSVWDGVYTDAQAVRGEQVFGTSCARCHDVADFTGSTFLLGWEASTALDLFRVLQMTMPEDNPGSLRRQDYADVVAYVFRANEFPAGDSELPADVDGLKLVRIEQKK